MKRKLKNRAKAPKRAPHKLQLSISWGGYTGWIANLEKLLRKPRTIRIEIIGSGEIEADAALRIREALLTRSPRTRVIMNAAPLCRTVPS